MHWFPSGFLCKYRMTQGSGKTLEKAILTSVFGIEMHCNIKERHYHRKTSYSLIHKYSNNQKVSFSTILILFPIYVNSNSAESEENFK